MKKQNEVVLSVEFEVYERYGSGRIKKLKAKADSEIAALRKLINNMNLYIVENDFEEWEESDTMPSFEELIERIELENGDGCDYIFELKNETTNQMYIKNDYFDDDWEWVD